MNQQEYQQYLLSVSTVEDSGLQRILQDPDECTLFKTFLDEEKSSEALLFWLEAESYRNTEDPSLLKKRMGQIMEKYFNPNSKYEINVNATIMKNIQERITKDDVDRTLFMKAQSSIFNLLEMDSLPRFLQSAIYAKYKETRKEKAKEDMTYLIARATHPEKGIKYRTFQRDGKIYSNSFVASEFIRWMIPNLFISISVAISIARKLQDQNVIQCVCSPTTVSADPKGHVFDDNDALWKFSFVNSGVGFKGKKALKAPEDIANSFKYKTCSRKEFEKVNQVIDYLVHHLEIISDLARNAWVIPRSEKNHFTQSLLKLFSSFEGQSLGYYMRSILHKYHSGSSRDLLLAKSSSASVIYPTSQKDPATTSTTPHSTGGSSTTWNQGSGGAGSIAHNSLLVSLLEQYYGYLGKDYVYFTLESLFSRKTFERDLSFDLNDNEDATSMKREFVKLLKSIIETMISPQAILKLPPSLKDICRFLNSKPLIAKFLFGAVIKALLKPDYFGIVSPPFLPLPKVKENLYFITRVIEHLIEMKPIPVKLGLNQLSFVNPYLEEIFKKLPSFIEAVCGDSDSASTSPTVSSTSSENGEKALEISPSFQDYCNVVGVFFNNVDTIESVFLNEQKLQLLKTPAYDIPLFLDSVKAAHRVMTAGEEGKSSSFLNNTNPPLRIHYCPIFPSSKFVLNFCLANHVAFEPMKVSFLDGDLKEEPILSHGDIQLSDCVSIVKYIAEKYCVASHWYPAPVTSGGMSGAIVQKSELKTAIDAELEWLSSKLAATITKIFWTEVYPKFSNSSSLSSVKSPLLMTSEELSSPALTQLELEKLYQQLNEYVGHLNGVLADKSFLIGSKLSVADLYAVELLNFVQIFQYEMLSTHVYVYRWYKNVTDSLAFWWEVNAEFEAFYELLVSVSDNHHVPLLDMDLYLNAPMSSVWEKMTEFTSPAKKIKEQAKSDLKRASYDPYLSQTAIHSSFQTRLQTKFSETAMKNDTLMVVSSHATGGHATVSGMGVHQGGLGLGGLVPERTIIQNYLNEQHIPNDHLSLLDYRITEPKISSISKLSLHLINVPTSKAKSSFEDDIFKLLKPFSPLQVQDMKVYYVSNMSNLPEILTDGVKLSALMKSKCQISDKVGTSFKLMDNSISGTNIEVSNSIIVQKWRLSDWPENHMSTLKLKFHPLTLCNRVLGMEFTAEYSNIPADKYKDSKNKLKQFWKKLNVEQVTSMELQVFFQESPSEVHSSLLKLANFIPSLSVTNIEQPTDSKYAFVLEGSCSEASPLSKVVITGLQIGDRDVRLKKSTQIILFQTGIPKQKLKSLQEFWEKQFWSKMKGIHACNTSWTFFFNLVNPGELYENLLNYQKFFYKKCVVSDEVDGEFSLEDSLVTGKNVKLLKNRVIEQKYRFGTWPSNHFATARYVIKELAQLDDKKEVTATSKLFVTHEAIPVKDYDSVSLFWEKFWKRFRNGKGGIVTCLPSKPSNSSSFLGNSKDLFRKIKSKSDS